ncbi:hypothetical protein, partial [Caballeronia sp.]|uniref:hypothetical protein n=1 Tax=Caballeronia sp. TaxID=1931223 RepID=UPI003C7014B0
ALASLGGPPAVYCLGPCPRISDHRPALHTNLRDGSVVSRAACCAARAQWHFFLVYSGRE